MFVGIDPSLSGTAVACYGGEVRRFGSSPCGPGIRERMQRYEDLVDDVLHWLPDNCRCICIEGYSFASKHGGEKLAEYGGLLRSGLCIAWPNAFLFEVAPNQLKKFATGKGVGKKTEVIGAVAATYGVTFKTDDEYDAYVLSLIAAALAGEFECSNQAQRDVIAALRDGPKKKSRKKNAA
jgi:crossover junction endodeoxyribonuclease RuvC